MKNHKSKVRAQGREQANDLASVVLTRVPVVPVGVGDGQVFRADRIIPGLGRVEYLVTDGCRPDPGELVIVPRGSAHGLARYEPVLEKSCCEVGRDSAGLLVSYAIPAHSRVLRRRETKRGL